MDGKGETLIFLSWKKEPIIGYPSKKGRFMNKQQKDDLRKEKKSLEKTIRGWARIFNFLTPAQVKDLEAKAARIEEIKKALNDEKCK